MAMTLVEAAKLSNDILKTGIIETVVKDSPILQQLPFIEIIGNGLISGPRHYALCQPCQQAPSHNPKALQNAAACPPWYFRTFSPSSN